MAKIITSLHNPLVKETALLLQKKYRLEKNLFLAEGWKVLYEGLQSGQIPQKIFLNLAEVDADKIELFKKLAQQKNVELYEVNAEIIQKLSENKTPQPIISLFSTLAYDFSQIKIADDSLILVLDSINDPGNLGTIIRTADAAGIQGIILNKNCTDPFGPKTLRASMGSIFHIPILTNINNEDLIRWLKQNNFQIAATSPHAKLSFKEANFSKPTALMLGSEAHGLQEYLVAASDFEITIPMFGKAESLNVAIAAAILLYGIKM